MPVDAPDALHSKASRREHSLDALPREEAQVRAVENANVFLREVLSKNYRA